MRPSTMSRESSDRLEGRGIKGKVVSPGEVLSAETVGSAVKEVFHLFRVTPPSNPEEG